jgi:predicted metal-dependent hydrolase
MANELDPSDIVIDVEGESVALMLRRHPRARRVSLRADPVAGRVVLVLPRSASLKSGIAFARRQTRWIRARLAQVPPVLPFASGSTIDVHGETLIVRHDPTHRGPALRRDDVLVVGGDVAFVARRIRDWLKQAARHVIAERVRVFAGAIERDVRTVRIADPRTRWGSCTASGRLNFSWRLVCSPPQVLDYVVAHEVAHLVHRNHSPRFWALVDHMVDHRRLSQAWLRRHGAQLLRQGIG